MTDSCTIEVRDTIQEVDVSATGFWSDNVTKRPENLWAIPGWGQIAEYVFSIASPATAIPGIWALEQQEQAASSAMYPIHVTIGRPISRTKALQIAQRILEQAERERIELAKSEAAGGVQWKEYE